MVNGDKRKRRKYLQTTKSQLLTEGKYTSQALYQALQTTKLNLNCKANKFKKNTQFQSVPIQPEKTADIWRRYLWFPPQMTTKKRAQKFHTDDPSLPRSGFYC